MTAAGIPPKESWIEFTRNLLAHPTLNGASRSFYVKLLPRGEKFLLFQIVLIDSHEMLGMST